MNRRALLLPLVLISPACAMDFTEPWEVKEPRLLGARVEVAGDPSRTRPRLDEPFSVRQYLALPGPLTTPLAERYAMDAVVCLALKAPGGELACVGEQELAPRVTAVSETEVLLEGLGLDVQALLSSLGNLAQPELPANIDLPALAAQYDLDRLALFGVLCVDGRAERVPGRSAQTSEPSQLFRCVDNEGAAFPDPSTFSLSVLLDLGRPFDRNQNPTFACDPSTESPCGLGRSQPGEALVPGPIVLARPPREDGAPGEVVPFPARSAMEGLPWEGCAADSSLLMVRAGDEPHQLRLRFDPSDRELYQYEIRSNGEDVVRDGRESLLVSHAITTRGGALERHFSQIDGERPDADAEVTLEYRPPTGDAKDVIPEGGRLVRFYFTLRDERGGVDFTTRELCVLPRLPE